MLVWSILHRYVDFCFSYNTFCWMLSLVPRYVDFVPVTLIYEFCPCYTVMSLCPCYTIMWMLPLDFVPVILVCGFYSCYTVMWMLLLLHCYVEVVHVTLFCGCCPCYTFMWTLSLLHHYVDIVPCTLLCRFCPVYTLIWFLQGEGGAWPPPEAAGGRNGGAGHPHRGQGQETGQYIISLITTPSSMLTGT